MLVALEVTLHLRRSTDWLFFTLHYITICGRPISISRKCVRGIARVSGGQDAILYAVDGKENRLHVYLCGVPTLAAMWRVGDFCHRYALTFRGTTRKQFETKVQESFLISLVSPNTSTVMSPDSARKQPKNKNLTGGEKRDDRGTPKIWNPLPSNILEC